MKRKLAILLLLTAAAVLLCMLPALAEEAAAVAPAEEAAAQTGRFVNTAWALLPPLIAIVLALLTKEVYSSLFVGVVSGALLITGGSFTATAERVFSGGIVAALSDSYNLGILVFLVFLGTLVCLMNRAGGSAAFGAWA